MNWLSKFMQGRYGIDQLSRTLVIAALVFTVLGSLTKLAVLTYISYIILGICIYRILSKNITKRRMENYKYSMLVSPIYSWCNKKISMLKDSKHRYFKCPNCKAQLRLPKGKGKIKIACPACKTEFIKKT